MLPNMPHNSTNRIWFPMNTNRLPAILALFALLGVLLTTAVPAHAATFTVTSLADDGSAGTLRAAITVGRGAVHGAWWDARLPICLDSNACVPVQ